MLEKHIITKEVDSSDSENRMNAIDCILRIHKDVDLKRLNRARMKPKPNRLNTLNRVVIRQRVPACSCPF